MGSVSAHGNGEVCFGLGKFLAGFNYLQFKIQVCFLATVGHLSGRSILILDALSDICVSLSRSLTRRGESIAVTTEPSLLQQLVLC